MEVRIVEQRNDRGHGMDELTKREPRWKLVQRVVALLEK